MKQILLSLCLLTFAMDISAQPLKIAKIKDIGCDYDDVVQTMIQTDDGDVVLAGNSNSICDSLGINIGRFDGWVMKLDSNWNIKWSKLLGGTGDDFLQKVIKTKEAGYLAVGNTLSPMIDSQINKGREDFWVVKLDADGNMVWQRSFGGSKYDLASSVVEAKDGSFLVVGSTGSQDGDIANPKGGTGDGWIICLDTAGNLLWQKAYGSSGADYLYSVQKAGDNSFLVIGKAGKNDVDVPSSANLNDVWVMKIDSAGSIIWNKTFGGSGYDIGYCSNSTSDGGYLIGCSTDTKDGDVTVHYGENDLWILKLDSLGDLQWQRTAGGTWDDHSVTAVLESKDHQYYAVGTTTSKDFDALTNHNSLFTDVLLLRMDTAGIILERHCYGGLDNDFYPSLIEKKDGRLLLSFTTRSVDGDVVNHGYRADGWLGLLQDSGVYYPNPVLPLRLKTEVSVYPNPFTNKITIKMELAADYQISLVDVLGRKLQAVVVKTNSGYEVKPESIASGLYFLRIRNAQKSFSTTLYKE